MVILHMLSNKINLFKAKQKVKQSKYVLKIFWSAR